MALFVLTCRDKPASLDLRMATREAHLAFVAAQPGVVKLGGPFLDEAGGMAGSLLVIDVPDRAAAEAFAAADPYGRAGLFSSVTIDPFRVTVGGFSS